MSKHTPGPWWQDGRIVRPANEAHPRRAAIAACDLSHGIGAAADEDEANARLIAAAPDMLDALRKAVVLLAGACVHSPELEPHETYEAVSAAIAKATGSAA